MRKLKKEINKRLSDIDVNGVYADEIYTIHDAKDNLSLKISLNYILDNFTDDDWKNTFPDIYESIDWDDYVVESEDEENSIKILYNYNKLGIFTTIVFPELSNFKFDGNNPIDWHVSNGHSGYIYVYADTIDELINKIKNKSKEIFQKYIELDK